jgi:hypothetical protein
MSSLHIGDDADSHSTDECGSKGPPLPILVSMPAVIGHGAICHGTT